jgi:hypothetical protein
MAISVILPVVNEHDNLRLLIPRLYDSLKRESLSYEIIVIDGGSIDGTPQTAEALGARVFAERRKGSPAPWRPGSPRPALTMCSPSTPICPTTPISSPRCGWGFEVVSM